MTTRAEALRILADTDAKLRALLVQVPPEAMSPRGTIGGGEWSALDLLGHIAFWEELAVAAADLWRAGSLPERREVDDLNAHNEEASRGMSLVDVQARYDRAHGRLVATIETLSDDEWNERRKRTDKEFSLGDLVGGTTAGDGPFTHAEVHLPDLETYVAALRVAT